MDNITTNIQDEASCLQVTWYFLVKTRKQVDDKLKICGKVHFTQRNLEKGFVEKWFEISRLKTCIWSTSFRDTAVEKKSWLKIKIIWAIVIDVNISEQPYNKTKGLDWFCQIGLLQGGRSGDRLVNCYVIIKCQFN